MGKCLTLNYISTIKTVLQVRPMYHHADYRIINHVKLCVLAYFIVRYVKVKRGKSFQQIAELFCQLHVVELITNAGMVLRHCELESEHKAILKALGFPDPKKSRACWLRNSTKLQGKGRETMKSSYSKQNSPSSAPNLKGRSEKMKQQILEYEQKKKTEEIQRIQQQKEDRRKLAAISTFQVVIGVIVTLVSHIVGVITYFAPDELMPIIGEVPFMLLIIFLLVVPPLLASSAVVYGIGRLKGYRGSYRATLLSGILPIAVYFFVAFGFWSAVLSAAVFDSIGEGPPAWSFFLLLGNMFLLPISETIGFHVSARRRTKR